GPHRWISAARVLDRRRVRDRQDAEVQGRGICGRTEEGAMGDDVYFQGRRRESVRALEQITMRQICPRRDGRPRPSSGAKLRSRWMPRLYNRSKFPGLLV